MVNIFYHKKDLDGHCSGAIARYYYECIKKKTVKMWPIDYGEEFPIDELEEGADVVLVDYHIDDFSQLMALSRKTYLVVIDHHKSFVDTVKENGVELVGYIESGKAACELAWEYFFNKEIPLFVILLGRYDVWDQSGEIADWDRVVYPFQLGMRLFNYDPQNDDAFDKWKVLFSLKNNYKEIEYFVKNNITTGKTIIDYQKLKNASFVDMFSFETNFDGFRAICMNSAEANSILFQSKWDESKYDIMFRYNFNGKHYIVSLYTTKKQEIDCSAIAKKYGGGGHVGAAGFQCKNITFDGGKVTIFR